MIVQGPAQANQGFQILSPSRAPAPETGFRVLGGAPPPVLTVRPPPPQTRQALPERNDAVAAPSTEPDSSAAPVAVTLPAPAASAPTVRIVAPRVSPEPRRSRTAAPASEPPVAPVIREAALRPPSAPSKASDTGADGSLPAPEARIAPPLPPAVDPDWVERIIRDAAGPALPELDVASLDLTALSERPPRTALPPALAGLNMAMLRDADLSVAEGRKQARQGLRQFLVKANKPPEGARHFAVKILLRHEGYEERIWVGDLEGPLGRKLTPRDRLHGYLLNLPEVMTQFNFGDRVAFAEADIEDWIYIRPEGGFAGNFTGCAVVAAEGEEALVRFVEEHRIDCGWLRAIQPVAN
jgi:uncharacterized protein YegJ (DUF2314 family)